MKDAKLKPSTTISQQVALLRSRGMVIDEPLARQWLSNVSYYRLSAGYRTFGVSFGAVFCCVGAVVRVLKLGWPGFMGGQKVCLGSGFFVVVPRDKSV